MRFEDTGLTKEQIVEDAFNYAYAAFLPEVSSQFKQQLDKSYQDQLNQLGELKESGQIDEEQFNKYKTQLDGSLDAQMKRLPQLVEKQAGPLFQQTRISPALELQKHSEKSSPELLAAALLLDTVRDPIDYQKLDAKFGAAVSGVVAEILHIDSHPDAANDNLAAAGGDAKRIVLAEIAANLGQILSQIEKAPPGSTLKAPLKYEENVFGQLKLLWGNDKKLDTRLVDLFNRTAEGLASSFRIELTDSGAPELVKSTWAPAKPAPGKKKGPRISGD